MNNIDLKAEKREVSGRKVKKLRKEGLLPAVLYGHDYESQSIQLRYGEFEKAFRLAGESTLVNLVVDSEVHPVLIHDVARDPVSDQFIHADFYKVRMDEKITTNVKLAFLGKTPAVDELGGILVKNLSELEVEALPGDLPHEIEVDISGLKDFTSQILVRDLNISDKIKILNNLEDVIASIQEPRSEEVEEVAVPSVEEVEVIKKEPQEEPLEETPETVDKNQN